MVAIAMLAALVLQASQSAAQEHERSWDVWDLKLGDLAASIPDRFVDYACGSNGGPPSRPIKGFGQFASCRRERNGLHEVYFRYDDRMEHIARALEQHDAVERYRGTQVHDFPVVVSALFDPGGALAGIRIVTDARDDESRPRHEHWALGVILMHRFGDDDWSCVDHPAQDGERAVGNYFIKEHCEKTADGKRLVVERRYLLKKGQSFTDPHTGRVETKAFESWTRFEAFAAN